MGRRERVVRRRVRRFIVRFFVQCLSDGIDVVRGWNGIWCGV